MQPVLFLITGLPGVGKSTVAQLLQKRTQGIILNSDEIRRELFPITRTYSSKETQAVISETERRATVALQEGGNVILDALFTKQNAREQYQKLAQEHRADFKVIFVTSTDEVVRERLELRPSTNNPSEATYDHYLDRKKYFEEVISPYAVIDNSGNLDSLINQVEDLEP
jgi:predicted kinase